MMTFWFASFWFVSCLVRVYVRISTIPYHRAQLTQNRLLWTPYYGFLNYGPLTIDYYYYI